MSRKKIYKKQVELAEQGMTATDPPIKYERLSASTRAGVPIYAIHAERGKHTGRHTEAARRWLKAQAPGCKVQTFWVGEEVEQTAADDYLDYLSDRW